MDELELLSKNVIQEIEENTLLNAQVVHFKSENERLAARCEALAVELQNNINNITDNATKSTESLNYANQNTLLLKRISQIEKSVEELNQQLKSKEAESKIKESSTGLELSKAHYTIELLKTPLQTSLENEKTKVEEYLRLHEKSISENYEAQLAMLKAKNEEIHGELAAAKKEMNTLRQNNDARIQTLRMKYEEQLLKLSQASNESGTVESLRKKLVIQKHESDAEIDSLRQMLSRNGKEGAVNNSRKNN